MKISPTTISSSISPKVCHSWPLSTLSSTRGSGREITDPVIDSEICVTWKRFCWFGVRFELICATKCGNHRESNYLTQCFPSCRTIAALCGLFCCRAEELMILVQGGHLTLFLGLFTTIQPNSKQL